MRVRTMGNFDGEAPSEWERNRAKSNRRNARDRARYAEKRAAKLHADHVRIVERIRAIPNR